MAERRNVRGLRVRVPCLIQALLCRYHSRIYDRSGLRARCFLRLLRDFSLACLFMAAVIPAGIARCRRIPVRGLRPLKALILPVMPQRRQDHRLRLRLEHLVRKGRRVLRVSGLLTPRRNGHFACVHYLEHVMRCVITAHNHRRDRLVVFRPLIERLAIIMAQRRTALHLLRLCLKGRVLEFRRKKIVSRLLTRRLFYDLPAHLGGLALLMRRVLPADPLRCHRLVVLRPRVHGCSPVVATFPLCI